MFASLVLALLAGVPAGDQILCVGSSHARPSNLASPPAYWFEPEVPWYARRLPAYSSSTPTNVSDGVEARVTGAKWFQSYSGAGGNGTYAVYDTASGAYYACAHQDTSTEFDAFQVPLGWIARAIPAGPYRLSLRTERGVHFGMSRAQVEAIYGRAKPLPAFYVALSYSKIERITGTNTEWTVTTTFYFDDDRLVGFERDAGI